MKSTLVSIVLIGLSISIASSIASEATESVTNLNQHSGVWRSKGYGYLLDIQPKRIALYHQSGSFCIKDPEPQGMLVFFDKSLLRNQQLVISSALDPYEYQFERLKQLPASCQQTVADTAKSNFDAFVEIYRRHYAFFALYGVDWPAQVEKFRSKVDATTTDSQLFDLLSQMLAPLKDSHIKLSAKIDGEKKIYDGDSGTTDKALAKYAKVNAMSEREVVAQFKRNYWFNGIQKQLLKERSVIEANGRIQYGMLDNQVGYLAIVTMGGFIEDNDDPHRELQALDVTLDNAITLYRKHNAKSLILDLSLNTGGYDFVANHIARRFAASPTLAYQRKAADDSDAKYFDLTIQPTTRVAFNHPVYLLTSDQTVSAAEALVLSMRPLEKVTHAGSKTRGALSTVLAKYLPNGWALSLSNEIYSDHQGKLWEGEGIPPEINIPVFDPNNPMQGHVQAVRQIEALIADTAGNKAMLRNEFTD